MSEPEFTGTIVGIPEEVARLRDNFIRIQFAASGYCTACGGWNANPGDPQRGCTPGWHTKDCWLRNLIDQLPEGKS